MNDTIARERRARRSSGSVRKACFGLLLVATAFHTFRLRAAYSAVQKCFPADAVVDVRTYGAKGDGRNDDTAAIQTAIRENVGRMRILYFPRGIYLISDTLAWRDAKGRWQAWLSLQGESRATVLRLKDATFTDPSHPKPVIKSASQNPVDANGGGNQAFGNSICDLTVDVGTRNPGAIGIDYLANNKGMIENVLVRTSDPADAGHIGIAMLRAWPGPCFLKNVEVHGFDFGIDVGQTQYSVTMEHVALKGQRLCGMRNSDNGLAVRDLVSHNAVPAVISRQGKDNRYGPAGLVVLTDSKLFDGLPGNHAIENAAHLFVRNVETTGYKAAVRDRGSDVPIVGAGEYASGVVKSKFGGSGRSLRLPVEETPTYWDNDLSHWRTVGVPSGSDDTAQIQAALDSGAATVYFIPGTYHVADTLRVRGQVRHLIGMDALLRPAKNHRFTKTPDTRSAFRFETPDKDVSVVVFERFNLFFNEGGRAVENASRKVLVIKSVISWASGGGYRNEPGAGRLFIEDFDPGSHQNDHTVFRSQKVWARQFNPEPRLGPHVVNDGGDLWIFGYKTEGIGPVLWTKSGGRTELLGGFHYWVYPEEDAPKLVSLPAYVVEKGEMSASFVTQRHQKSDHDVYLREVRGGTTRDTRREELPGRFGHPSDWQRAVPLFVGRREGSEKP